MNYEAIPFDLNNHTGPSAAADPPVPTYEPPSPPRKGFSRSPMEDEVAVCPQCNDELGIGEDETKRQVWVVKACGHVGFQFPPSFEILSDMCELPGVLWRMQ